MRILFAIPTLRNGGAERVVSRLAGALCERHEVHIATFANGLTNAYETDPRVVLHELVGPKSSFKPYTVAYGFLPISRWRDLHLLKRRLGVDVCASFLTDSNQDNICSRAGERTVVSVRNILTSVDNLDPLRRARERIRIEDAAKNTDAMVAVTRGVAAEQIGIYGVDPAKVTVIHNPVDVDEVRAKAALPVRDEQFERLRDSHDHVVVALGRLMSQKGHWHLVRAFREVARQTSAALVILGQGELNNRLRCVIEANGLADHVYLAGFRENPFAYMAHSDLLAMSSLYEGFSNVMIEAMACGLPIVSTDCNSGPRDLLAPSTDPAIRAEGIDPVEFGVLTPKLSGNEGLLDEPLEPEEEAFAQALLRMLDSRELRQRYSRLGELRIRDFTLESIAAQWAQVLQVPWETDA